MNAKHAVKLTAQFERHLDELERLLQADSPRAFDALLAELTDTVIPNLERFPRMGQPLLEVPARSVEARQRLDSLTRQVRELAEAAELREYVMKHYHLLYACIGTDVHLLSIRHHHQLSFDFPAHWPD